MNRRIMTIDLEPDLRSKHCQSIKVLPKLLDLFDDYKIKATFFTVSSLLEKYESEIKALSRKGHEIASHSHTHDWLNPDHAEAEIRHSKEMFKEYHLRCNGFRAPGFRITKDHFLLLTRYGYKYDSSLATYFPGRYNNLRLPQEPFWHKNILEFPLPTFIYPSINSGLTYLKLLHPVSKIFSQKYMFYLHPWEFLEKHDFPKQQSILSLLLQRNAGHKAWDIFRSFIEKEDTKWISCRDWMDKII